MKMPATLCRVPMNGVGFNRWLVSMLAGFFCVVCPAFAQTEFYSAAGTDLAHYANGGLIRSEPMDGAPDGASAYRVLYRSEGLHGEPIAVSGVVIVPAGPAPADGRLIVAWAHPTTGIVSKCAPSLARVLFSSIQGLHAMLQHNYVVAATDYPGLGTAGPHPYLVGVSEGRAVLDSVRVARTVPGAGNGKRFAVWGHSQGGQAALFTGILAHRYAPELQLVGVAAASPATELGTLLSDDMDTSGGRNITAMTLWSWSQVYDAPMTNAVTPAAIPVIDRLAGECIERFFDVLIRRGPSRALDPKLSEGGECLRRCAVEWAAGREYAGDASCGRSCVSCAGDEGPAGFTEHHAWVYGQVVQGGERGSLLLDAECRTCLRGEGQRFDCCCLDRGPVCGDCCSE